MKYVYLLQSLRDPTQRYIGLTSDVKARLAAHNAGQSPHTSKHRPWKLGLMLAFDDADKAAAFERYLKTGSGYAFAKRHLW
jgi:predicted GIY-YIG superfamily endonuclease